MWLLHVLLLIRVHVLLLSCVQLPIAAADVHTFLHVLLTSCVHLSCEGYTIIPIPFVAFAVVADK